MYFSIVIVFFIICTSQQEYAVYCQPSCGEDGDCLSGPVDCDHVCGCDRAYYYNETTGECTLKASLMNMVLEKYHPEGHFPGGPVRGTSLAKTITKVGNVGWVTARDYEAHHTSGVHRYIVGELRLTWSSVGYPETGKTVLGVTNGDDSNIPESILAKTVRIEANEVFRGIIISAIIFITCAGVCVLSSCVYCFRINYTDYVLKRDVKALAKKIGRDKNFKKASVKRKVEPIAENCPVIVENAGVFVV